MDSDTTAAPQIDDDAGNDVPIEMTPVSDPIATARRRHGAAGAMLAAGMFGVDIALGRKPKEEAPIVVASSSEPVDIETDGIEVPIDETTSVFAPPQPPVDPFAPRPRRKR
ncbi:MAG: hypothetical protein WCC60_01330 [Ilumatobacteraceae bacterium]